MRPLAGGKLTKQANEEWNVLTLWLTSPLLGALVSSHGRQPGWPGLAGSESS